MTQEVLLKYPFGEMALKYLKVIISWPGVSLLLGLIIIILFIVFKKHIVDLISAIQTQNFKFSKAKDGYSLEFNPKQQDEKPNDENNLLKNVKKEDVEKFNQNTPANVQPDKKIESIDELEVYISKHPKEIIKEYINLIQYYDFEKIYNNIFGTQIKLLDFINDKKNQKCTLDDVFIYYNESKEKGLKTDYYNLSNYLNYLFTQNLLIEKKMTDDYFEFYITEKGANFINYIKMHYNNKYLNSNIF